MKKNRSKSLRSLIEKYEKGDILSTLERDYSSNSRNELVSLDLVKFNPISKQQFFLDYRLKDLTESIKKNGVMSPILVRERDGKFEVVSGFKRFYIAKKLRLKEIPVAIRDVSDDLLIYMILSRGNKKLHDNILNKTYAYQILTNDYHVSRRDIALISKSSVSQVTNILRLANLDEEVKIALKKEKISYGQARVLLGIERQLQAEFLNKIIEKNLSVREIERLVKEYKEPSPYIDKIYSYEKNNNCKISKTEKSIKFNFETKEELNNFIDKILN